MMPLHHGKSALRKLALPGTQRDTLILISGSGLSYEAAALVADCKLGTVKSRFNCGRAAMGTIIADAETLPNC